MNISCESDKESNNIMDEKQVLLLVKWPQKTSHLQNDTEDRKQYTTNFTPATV
jgi:hypothetical protein